MGSVRALKSLDAQVAGLVGSVVLPVLGAVPDGMMLLICVELRAARVA